MSSDIWCKKCDGLILSAGGCICRSFEVWRVDGETVDDARAINASSAEYAVEKWAGEGDSRSADYSIVGGSDADVMVRDEAGLTTRWNVSGRSEPVYSAIERDLATGKRLAK